MAIRKEPARRYASVGDLGSDILRYLDGRPVKARPDTFSYRASKFLRRNRVPMAVAGAAAVVAVGLPVARQLTTPTIPRVLRVNQLTQSGHVALQRGIAADDKHVYFVEGTPGGEVVTRVPVDGGASQELYGPYPEAGIADISQDGSRLLLKIGDRSEDPEVAAKPLWEGATNGGTLKRIGNIESRYATFSPDLRRIAFCGVQSISEVNRDGSGLRQLLNTAGRVSNLRWSPLSLGSVLRFAEWTNENHKAALREGDDGGNVRPLFEDWMKSAQPGSVDGGVWGSGGRYYYFRSYGSAGFNIWATRRAPAWLGHGESAPVLIHSTPTRIDRLAASPGGQYAFFVSYQERGELARFDAGLGEFRPFLAGVSARFISFSKDGKWMAYTSMPGDTLWRSRADGSEAARLTPPGMRTYAPNWSPDGTVIAFSAYVPGKGPGAYTIASGGGIPRRLGDEQAMFGFPLFSPNGTKLVMSDMEANGLAVIDWKTKAIVRYGTPNGEQWAIWLADGRHVLLFSNGEAVKIDVISGERSVLLRTGRSNAAYLCSHGDLVYFQVQDQPGQPIYRVPSGGGRPAQVASANSIPQSDPSRYEFVALDPSDAPIVSIVRRNSDLYSLELDLP